MENTPPTGRATDYPEPSPNQPAPPPTLRFRVPLLRVLIGVTVLAVLVSLHPVLRQEIKFSTVCALALGSVSLVAGAAWKNRERGLATGFVLSGILAAKIWFYVAALGWSSVMGYAAPLFGIGLLLLLPLLLGYLGGRYTEEKGELADAALRRAEPLWSVAVLVLCSVALVFAVGIGSSRPAGPNRGPEKPLPPVPLVAAPQTTQPVAWGTITASFQDLRQIRPPGKGVSNGSSWSPFYGMTLLSADGEAVVGQSRVNESNGMPRTHGHVWTEKGGYVDLNKTYPELRHLEQIMASSHDGSVMHVRYSSPAMSGESIWRKDGGLQTDFADKAAEWVSAHPDTPSSSFGGGNWLRIHAISGDGETILLTSGQVPLRWTERGGFGRIAGLKREPTVRAVTRTGDAFAGHNGVNAFVWTERNGMVEIPRIAGTGSAVAYGVSRDGAYVTGTSGNYLFRWTPQGGTENLGRLPGDSMIASGNAVHIESRGYTISDDGKIVVGSAGNIPFIWTKQSGVIPLREVLANCGASVAGSPVESAVVSADGRRITGLTREGAGLHRWRLLIR